tara:strand:- start:1357 stop:1878 length:522 start_codon:yes stop_codon:yes gene_type:complete
MSQLRVNSIVPVGGVQTSGAYGGIIQIKPAFTNLTTVESSSNTFADITDMSVTITPSSTASKFLIMTNMTVAHNNSGAAIFLNLVRNSTPIAQNQSSSFPCTSTLHFGNEVYGAFNYSYQHLDETNLTNTNDITYKWQMRTNIGAVTVNQRSTANDLYSTSNLIVCEVTGVDP